MKSPSGVGNRMLRIELAKIKQTLENGEIEQISWVRREEQLADCLTREGGKRGELRQIMRGERAEREGEGKSDLV